MDICASNTIKIKINIHSFQLKIRKIIKSTPRMAGASAEEAENLKRMKYAVIGDAYIFLSFGVETMGLWGLLHEYK